MMCAVKSHRRHVEAPPTYEEVMETRRPCGTPKPAPYIDEWLSWGKGASIRAGQGRGHVKRHPQKGGKGKQGGPATSWLGKGQVSQAHSLHQYQPAPARLPSPPLSPPLYTPRRHPLQEQGQKRSPPAVAREDDGVAEEQCHTHNFISFFA
mmetsp:Transcript_61491/g.102012  ORF Transcript_61491/g.102012 Transcript_61491/m.102012 type:complete len:151 (+) Transcript_61491:406-858(+)